MSARPGKILVVVLLAAVGIVLLLLAAALTAPVQTAVARHVLSRVNENLTGHLMLGKVHVLPSGRLMICDIGLADATGLRIAHVDSLVAQVNIRALLHDNFQVQYLRVTGITCEFRVDSNGHSNVERALAARKPSAPSRASVRRPPSGARRARTARRPRASRARGSRGSPTSW